MDGEDRYFSQLQDSRYYKYMIILCKIQVTINPLVSQCFIGSEATLDSNASPKIRQNNIIPTFISGVLLRHVNNFYI